MRAAVAAGLPALAAGHGAVQRPPTWWDAGGKMGMTAGTQCVAGCTGKTVPLPDGRKSDGCACMWYTNYTMIPGAPTMAKDSPLRTYTNVDPGAEYVDWTKTHPWRAPGTAPIVSPCGVDGGNPDGCPKGNPSGAGCAGGGWGRGQDARTMGAPKITDPPTTEWKAGSVVDAAWGLTANHGGGYSYRLCPGSHDSGLTLTEECFQQTPLKFHGDTQWIQWGADDSTRKAFQGMKTTNGTFPVGSEWMRNPIPACKGTGGGSVAGGGANRVPQFPPPSACPTCFGFGNDEVGGGTFMWSVVDQLEVPKDITPGNYVLSFRWDCEQTTQVWNSCSNVHIVA